MTKNKTSLILIFSISAGFISISGCSRPPEKEPDCVNPPPTKAAPAAKADSKASTNRRLVEGAALDWCRACVVGPHGFMSCQRLDAAGKEEPRDALRKRARLAACLDSGFTEATCPDESVIAITCKDDKPVDDKMAAGKKLLKALENSGPLVLKGDVKATKTLHIGASSGTTSKNEKKTPTTKAVPK